MSEVSIDVASVQAAPSRAEIGSRFCSRSFEAQFGGFALVVPILINDLDVGTGSLVEAPVREKYRDER
jgi:hypothetical protein